MIGTTNHFPVSSTSMARICQARSRSMNGGRVGLGTRISESHSKPRDDQLCTTLAIMSLLSILLLDLLKCECMLGFLHV